MGDEPATGSLYSPSTEVAILKLQSSLDIGLTKIAGQLDVILQRLDQQDARADDHAEQLASLDVRLNALERSAVTRADMETRQASSARTVAIVVSIIAMLTSAGVSLLIAFFP